MNEPLTTNRLLVDKALYTSIATVLKILNLEYRQNISSVNTLIEAKKGKGFHKTQKEIFMGILLEQVNVSQSQSLRLSIQEVSQVGQLGVKYTLFLYKSLAEEFSKGNFQGALKKNEKVLLIFRNAPYKYKAGVDSEIEFHLTEKSNATLMIKHSFLSAADSGCLEDYAYLTLTQAAGEALTNRCNFYGVMSGTLKAPAVTNRNSIHGMLLLVDPSCYEGSVSKTDYPLHIFSATRETYPKVIVGDIIRVHRAKAEVREGKGKPDFRIFNERDIVVFPSNPNIPPQSHANRFTFTDRDVVVVEQLRQWSRERFHHPPEVAESSLKTLSQIPVDRPFNLACRLVQHFDEANFVDLWVEDGTSCSLFTCNDAQMTPFDSEATQDVVIGCRRICVRAPRQAIGNVHLQNGIFLHLTHVETVLTSWGNNSTVAQFQLKGDVELLPPRTRYYNTLQRNLGKEQPSPHKEPPSRPEQQETAPPVSSAVDMSIDEDLPVTQVATAEAQANESQTHGNSQNQEGKTSQPPSDHSTYQAMAEMSSDVFLSRERELLMPSSPPSSASIRMGRESLDREENRLLMLINPTAASQESEIFHSNPLCRDSQVAKRQMQENLNALPSQLNLSFTEAVTSTQKPVEVAGPIEISDAQHLFPTVTVTVGAENDGSSSSQGSQGGQSRSGRRTCVVHPRSQISVDLFDLQQPSTSSTPGKGSPCPVYRANNEVLDIVTQTTQKTASPKTLPKQPPKTQIVEEGEEDLFKDISDTEKDPKKSSKGRPTRNIQWKDEGSTSKLINDPFVTRIVGREEEETIRKRKIDSLSCQEITVESQDELESQDSDDDSIIVYNPQSQPDLEHLFSAVETFGSQDGSQPVVYSPSFIKSITEPLGMEPGTRFRIRVQIGDILPLKPTGQDQVRLEDLLVAFCFECHHIWQYHHFRNSTSLRVRRKRRPRKDSDEDSDACNRVLNFLCSEEEYQENLRSLITSKDLDDSDNCTLDELCNIDYSYVFICPMCKLDGKPDVLCQLEPSFFFWLHVRDQPDESDNCLHVLAAGIHAEYFLGSKADHVCRSDQVWHRAKERLEKLLQDETKQKQMTLCIRKSPSHPDELYLEDTYVVYNSNHILPCVLYVIYSLVTTAITVEAYSRWQFEPTAFLKC